MDDLIASTSSEGSHGGDRAQAEAFFSAIRQGKIRIVSNLIDNGCDVNARNENQRTPLMQAVFVQKDDVRTHIVRMLLGRGCDVNKQDEDGRTALMLAAFEPNRDDVVRRVVSTGKCDPNVRDLKGDTALIYAVYGGNASVIRILVNTSHTKAIIDVDAVNNDRINPLKLAFKLRQDECVRVLVEEGRANLGVIKDRDVLNTILGRGPAGGGPGRAAPLRPETGGLSRAHALNSNTRSWADPFGDLLQATSTTYNPDTDILDGDAGGGKKKVKRYKKKKPKRTATVHPDNDSDELDGTSMPLGPLVLLSPHPVPSNTARSRTSYSQEPRTTATPSSMMLGMDSYYRDAPTSHSNYSNYSKNKRLTPLTVHSETNLLTPQTPRQRAKRGQFAVTPETPNLPARAAGNAAGNAGGGLLWWSTSDEYDNTPAATGRDSTHANESRARVRRKKKPKARLSPLLSGYRTPSSRRFADDTHGPSKGSLLPAIPSANRKLSLIGSPDVYNSLNF